MERLKYYIGEWDCDYTVHVTKDLCTFKQNELVYYPGPNRPAPVNFSFRNGIWNEAFWWRNPILSIDFECLSISADGIDNKQLPAVAKVRHIGESKSSIILPMGYNRHWGNVKNAKDLNKKIAWNNKIDDVVWRGVPTGVKKVNDRILLCETWGDKLNVGITQTWNRFPKTLVKPQLSIEEMMRFKYILSVEGNDKDSGINWKLASNSVVIMRQPTIESWLMEGLLEPYVHFVPVENDFSDLQGAIDWCRSNDEKCREIVKNANQFMEQFSDYETESKLAQDVKNHYISHIKFDKSKMT